MTSSEDAGRAAVSARISPVDQPAPRDERECLTVISHNLASIKAEMARGLRVDPVVVAKLEAALARYGSKAPVEDPSQAVLD